jgi:uncharacterized surface protein with fasciclin (FAS1) repeats
MISSRRFLALLAALAALSVFVAACGSDDDDESDAAATTQTETMESAGQDIVAVAQSEPSLSTLVDAITAAGLVETLQGEGPFTVFAPTNDAFEALGEEQLNTLLKPKNQDQLADILTYHVVPGETTAAMLEDGQQLETVQGETLTVRITGDTVKVGGASVVQPDVEASNGVVHVIDSVLTPSG